MNAEPLYDQVLDTWRIHHRINLYLLDAVPDEALGDMGLTKGRSVGDTFAHLHNVRLMWLKEAGPDLLEVVEKLEKGVALDRTTLRNALETSAAAVERLLERGLEGGRIKGFRPHAVAFLGYLVSHESHHRGQIAVALKGAGHPLDKKTAYGLWEWGVR